MAFFGLTALGPQNHYSAAHGTLFTVSLFEDEEFIDAFDQISKKVNSSTLSREEIEDSLRILFHGEVPPVERIRIWNYLDSINLFYMTKEQFLEVVTHLRKEELEVEREKEKKMPDHYSAEMLRTSKLKEDPQANYAMPLTSTRDIGWRASEGPIGFVRYPKKHCEETKFAGELFKYGHL